MYSPDFADFLEFSPNIPSDDMCDEHPWREHGNDEQMAGPSSLSKSTSPDSTNKFVPSDAIDPRLIQMASTQMSGTSSSPIDPRFFDLTMTVYSKPPNPTIFGREAWEYPMQSAMGYTTPVSNFSQLSTNDLRRSGVYQNSRQLAMRHMAPAVKRSYPAYFRPRIINVKILEKVPTIAISPVNDHYPERLALTPTDFPECFADLDDGAAAYGRLTLGELKRALRQSGLQAPYKKADVIARLREHGIDPVRAEALAVKKNSFKKRSTDHEAQTKAFERQRLDHIAMLKGVISKTAEKILPQPMSIAKPNTPSKQSTKSSSIDIEEPADGPDESAVESNNDNDHSCTICLKLHTRKGNRFIFCGGCNLAIHQKCHNPPISKIPNRGWFCLDCRPQENSAPHSTKRKRKSHEEDEEEQQDVRPAKRTRTQEKTKKRKKSSPKIWTVEDLVDRRVKGGKEQFRVRWSGFDSTKDTWEPPENLIDADWKMERLRQRDAPKAIRVPRKRQK
jgi:hypothetical protein